MAESDTGKEGPSYWRSLRELHDAGSLSESKANEFMAGVTGDFDLTRLPPISRKRFLALLSASAAFAAAGCTNYHDRGEIVPYNKKPEESSAGIANHYASTCSGCSQACGILVKTREGRPIKIDGNPDHPVNSGKICAKGQAGVQDLYDPYRLRRPVYGPRSGKIGDLSWARIDEVLTEHLKECTRAAREVAIVTHAVQSPSTQAVLKAFKEKYPTTQIYAYDLFSGETRREAWGRCYGSRDIPAIQWEKASVILALEADFLGTEGQTVENVRAFARGRDIMESSEFNRLYAIEGDMSLTGANADFRIPLRPDAQLEFVLSLLHELVVVRQVKAVSGRAEALISRHSLGGFAASQNLPREVVGHLVDDLIAHRGRSIVYAGDSLSVDVHVAVNYLNEVLDNTALFDGDVCLAPLTAPTGPEAFDELIRRMKGGEVGLVIHYDSNPAYHLPASFGYGEALRSVPMSVSLVENEDESASLSTYILPIHHALESWGDFHVRSGVYALRQPVIAPLYDTRQKEAILLQWAHEETEKPYGETIFHEFLKQFWETRVYPDLRLQVDFKTFWYSALHDGVVRYGKGTVREYRFLEIALDSVAPRRPKGTYVVLLTPSHFMGDGRFANNGWLQEIPHPISKIVWDNYAALSPTTASELGVEANDRIQVQIGDARQTLPVWVQPGLADGVVSVALGYGRWNGGPVGTGVGTNALLLLPKSGLLGSRVYSDAVLQKTEGRHALVSTQEHHSLDDAFLKDLHTKRGIIREGTLLQYMNDNSFLQHESHELFSISKEVTYQGLKWAMAVDMNKCTGCNACVAGCNVENNIPVVGKEEVATGREMHWIRLDRYYSGTPENPTVSHQPMLCQHCDNAPCENVCPVVATTHSPDGLNQMTYNRCVGTKYCSNNCPYKVRRFNFFNYRDHFAEGFYEQEPLSLLHNPEVTVRSRGVMEKCTFCVQRIMEARQRATEEGREIEGTDVKTACQEACPAQAIVFGDMNDPDSDVSRYRGHELGYSVIEEVNARPNVTYIAKLRNTHSEKLT
jgi:molybdopterin-containing oxidoreductase family iron-sulfur binding subunit